MLEAGVAYYEATGKCGLLDIVIKNADLIYEIFINQKHGGVPGRPEIELALIRLYRITENAKYFELAKYFIDGRRKTPNYFESEAKSCDWSVWGMDPSDTDYMQNTLPVCERRSKDLPCIYHP